MPHPLAPAGPVTIDRDVHNRFVKAAVKGFAWLNAIQRQLEQEGKLDANGPAARDLAAFRDAANQIGEAG